ncbi:hypothetical protein TWF506_004257 [Arthrobotrys conoides]|uniref:Uncharacterized protein n=1 Tax=Arthrobotrys conoides TaxID=74498 RepID=A0AAN8N2V3_9PEZI
MPEQRAIALFRGRRAYVRPTFTREIVPHKHKVRFSICGHQYDDHIFERHGKGDDPVKYGFDDRDKIVRYISERVVHGSCLRCTQQTERLLERLRIEEAQESEEAIAARAAANGGDFGWEELNEDWVPVENDKKQDEEH